MKPFARDIFRSFGRPMSRFFAIFAIVGLGAGFFAGLRATPADMRASGDSYFDKSRFQDVRLLSTMGFTSEDVRAVRQTAGVEQVMPSYTADVLSQLGGMERTVQMHALPESGSPEMNRLTVVSGRLPQKAGECVVGSHKNGLNGIRIGDTLSVSSHGGSQRSLLGRGSFRIVGVVDSPAYLSYSLGTTRIGSGQVGVFAYARPEDFDRTVYTELLVRVVGAAGENAYSSAYDDRVAPVKKALEKLADNRERGRHDELAAQAERQIQKAQSAYDKSKRQADAALSAARAKLTRARAAIGEGETQLRRQSGQLRDGEQALALARRQLEVDQKKLKSSAAALSAAREKLDGGRRQWRKQSDELAAQKKKTERELGALKAGIGSGLPGMPPDEETYEQTARRAEQKLEAARKELDAAEAGLKKDSAALDAENRRLSEASAAADAGSRKLEAQAARLAESRRQLDAARKRLDGSRAELAKGEADYRRQNSDAESRLESARRKLDDGRAAAGRIGTPEWFVQDRHDNSGFKEFGEDAGRMDSISTLFPVIFFLVAALVSLTAMTRMVEEQRVLIGTYKALGFGRGRIALKYLVYAAAASVLGAAAGIATGMRLLPDVIWKAYGVIYSCPVFVFAFTPGTALLSGATAVLCTLAATWAACRTALRETPASLMLPRAPKPGRRILLESVGPVWKRLSFIGKVTARNLFRYKKRFWMTVVGIAGCTSLLLTGFGLSDAVTGIMYRQFDLIDLYDTFITVSDGVSPGLRAILNDRSNFSRWQRVFQKHENAKANGREMEASLYVPENASKLDDFINLRDRRSGRPVAFGENSVLLTEKLARTLNVRAGGAVTLTDDDGRSVRLRVTGVTENYVYHYVYVAPAVYRRAFGAEPQCNTVQAVCTVRGTAGRQALQSRILKQEKVSTSAYIDDLRDQNENMVHSVNQVVVVLIVAAALLAFVVLYNLTTINITERVREIATIKVLGFFDGEVNAYIYRETFLLTLIGCALGLGLGVVMNSFVVKTAEIDWVMFGRVIRPLSFVLSAALTLAFSLLVDAVTYRRLQRIDMVESLKSVD